MTFRIEANDTWSYEQITVLDVLGQQSGFPHHDSSPLTRVVGPTPNPLAQ